MRDVGRCREHGICFAGCGVSHPAGTATPEIPNAIGADTAEWKRTATAMDLCPVSELTGSSRVPPLCGLEPLSPVDRKSQIQRIRGDQDVFRRRKLR